MNKFKAVLKIAAAIISNPMLLDEIVEECGEDLGKVKTIVAKSAIEQVNTIEEELKKDKGYDNKRIIFPKN